MTVIGLVPICCCPFEWLIGAIIGLVLVVLLVLLWDCLLWLKFWSSIAHNRRGSAASTWASLLACVRSRLQPLVQVSRFAADYSSPWFRTLYPIHLFYLHITGLSFFLYLSWTAPYSGNSKSKGKEKYHDDRLVWKNHQGLATKWQRWTYSGVICTSCTYAQRILWKNPGSCQSRMSWTVSLSSGEENNVRSSLMFSSLWLPEPIRRTLSSEAGYPSKTDRVRDPGWFLWRIWVVA